MTQYVLRAYCFGYNDENFYVCGTRIGDVFDDREKAEAAYREAQLAYLSEIDLAEHEKFFNGDDAYIRKMDAFLHEKTGEHIIGENGWLDLDTTTHTELSEDDLFEFGEVGELHGFKLIEFDDAPVFHALWDPKEEKYFHTLDEGFDGIAYGQSRDDVLELIQGDDIIVGWEGWEARGTLEELSDNPAVLRRLIESTDYIEYDETERVVRITDPESKTVIALNELLKAPIFEIRELDVETIRSVEKDLDGTYIGGQVGYFDGCGVTIAKTLAWILVPLLLVTASRCYFGTCESFLGALGNLAWLAFKYLALLVVGTVLLIWGLIKLGSFFRKRGKKSRG